VKTRRLVVASLAALAGVPLARAAVNQVDGTVLPQTNALQGFLNAEEGRSPPNPLAINAVVEARQIPEVFLPDTASPVTFKDVAEGAGFENSFGYYNVGDDVSNTANLHPILGCGVAVGGNVSTQHQGAAAGYVQNAEPGGANNTATIDFAVELAAGRYKGGFIGFYLIAPEGNPSSTNCGDFKNGGDGNSLFGKIYFTERDLNNDGDFVHSLVFHSNDPMFPDRFYFGFEDLFRGGDNDFEDMLIKVDGLTPPCLPVNETCNGVDDDCDGTIDDAPGDVGDPCSAGVGECENGGVTICQGGNEVCNATPGAPGAELCNGLDDDCNGVADNSPTDVGDPCTAGLGECQDGGVTVCSGGLEVCNAVPGTPGAETCNGLDDDCDGLVDDGFNVGLACDGVGACGAGVIECRTPTTTGCSTDPGGSQDQSQPELCNGVDDDCDGQTDDAPGGVGDPCSAGVGACQQNGVTICSGGAEVCGVGPGAPQAELCNGIDDDCDGPVDEDFGVGVQCDGVGECGLGVVECRTVLTTGCSTDPGGSQDQSQPESCDLKDNDCDTTTDEGLTDLGPCGQTSVGECEDGVLSCSMGNVVCVGAITPTPELCDSKDNDCDGVADDSPIDEGNPCGIGIGQCTFGTEVCMGGMLQCTGGTPPGVEVCNGLDDDCDGVADDNPMGLGQPCGATEVGECAFGVLVCSGGAPVCSGEIGPSVEVCDDKDNDCDGVIDDSPVDVGGPCGVGTGVCTPGVEVCLPGGVKMCQGAMGGVPEVCNGLDDDCNGIVDDNPSDVGGQCTPAGGNPGVGLCTFGMIACIAGAPQCVGGVLPGMETCNGKDDDCDGVIDDGSLCADGICKNGSCSFPCPDELGCPVGYRCDEDSFCVPDLCATVICTPQGGTKYQCDPADGTCVPACSLVDCGGVLVCRESDGLCVPDTCQFLPDKCAADEVCKLGACVHDACATVTCSPDEFCRPDQGTCVKSCAGVMCNPGEKCHDGVCQPTGCDGACPLGQRCDGNGGCEPDPCFNKSCSFEMTCDPATGECVADPCLNVQCPMGQQCFQGDCWNPDQLMGMPDAAPRPAVYATGDGGCGVTPGGRGGRGGGAAWVAAAAVLALAWRTRRRAALLALMLVAGLGGGCDVDPYYLGGQGGGADAGDGGGGNGDGGGGPDAMRPDASCVVGAPDDCDGIDNDCDGLVDEDIDKQTDEQHCGGCNVACEKAGAITECQLGACAIVSCFPGFVDSNGDIDGPYAQSDGCEYMCLPSNGGVEACDGLDNDCDGAEDEDTQFQTDESNCGQCGRVCAFFHADATCQAGTCVFDPAVDCDPGFSDLNGQQDDGCEYQCSPTNGGTELCDAVDNDCDGAVDEGFGLDADPQNCGLCGRQCSFPNATPHCVMGACEFTAPADCAPGFHDINGQQLDGCEYQCSPSNGSVEICDLVDNDCDGVADEAAEVAANDPTIGVACGQSAVGECQLGATVCAGGNAVCVGAVGPKLETCNGKDDDCDGAADDAADLVDTNHLCAPSVGQCSVGLTVCSGGVLGCERAVGPSPEICDGIDNDCDGVKDDAPSDAGQLCGGGMVNGGTSQCVRGTTVCAAGALSCQGAVGPTAESCDGVDNDCDGSVDDTPLLVGSQCGSAVGECTTGTFVCTAGNLVCQGGTGPAAEICDGADNDCDGTADDNVLAADDPRVGMSCGLTATGECSLGTQICSSGNIVCTGDVGPTGEVCDNQDDDCDGLTDENAMGQPLTQACYGGPSGTQNVGVCKAGTQTCAGGSFGACAGQTLPGTETCNGLDDDCDAVTDEAAGGGPLTQSCYTGPMGTSGVGICHGGVQTCAMGSFGACAGEQTPLAEVCGDGLNNDCDASVSDASEGCWAALGSEFRLCGITGSGTTSNAGQHHSFEPAIASVGSNVYVAFADDRTGRSQIYLARSTDGGATWQSPLTRVTDDSTDATSPRVVALANGASDVVVVTFTQFRANQTRDVFAAISLDGGASFSNNRRVRLDANDDTHDAFHADVAIIPSGANVKVAVTWEELDTGNLSRRVLVRRTKDAEANSTTWDTAQTANKGAGSPNAGRPRVVFGTGDRVVVVWRERRSGGNGTFDVYSNVWDDAQASINATDLRIDADSGAPGEDDLPVVASIGGEIYVAWEELKADGGDILFARSTNSGTSWSAQVILDDPASEVSSSASPAIAAATVSGANRVFVAWVDDRSGTEIFVARSTNAGASFAAGVRASSLTNPGPGVSLEPSLVADGAGRVGVAFTSDRNGFVDVFAGFSIDGGVTFQPTDIRLDGGSGDSVEPAAALRASGGMHVVWVDFRANGSIADVYHRAAGP
jgi:hypothetical protein